MAKYKVYYAGEALEFEVPPGWKVIGFGEPRSCPPIENVQTELERALEKPVGTGSLKSLASSAETAVIISDDQTRPTPARLIIPEILDLLNVSGISDSRITVVVGRGTHRSPREEEVKAKVGGETLDRVNVEVHDPDKKAALKYLGVSSGGTPVWINRAVVEADLKVGVGNIVPHYFAGYGGGGKIVLPGVSGRETIVRNHIKIGDPNTAQGRLEGNVVYSDMLEVARRAGLDMKVDVILNMENEVACISAGEVGAEHRRGIEAFNEIYGFVPPRKADITITCGYPLEMNLIQSSKAVMSADLTTKDGGAIILLSACYDGVGHGLYETLVEMPEPEEVIEWIADGRSLPSGGPIASRTRAILKRKKIVVVTDGVSHDKIEDMGMTPYSTLEEAIEEVYRSSMEAEVIILSTGSSINPII